MLAFLGAAAAGLLDWGCGRPQAAIRAQAAQLSAGAIPSCVRRPEQIEGPYYIEEALQRSDIRSDPTDGSIRPGVPLRLIFQVSRDDKRGCTPLPEAVVHVWQCDALGVYSDVRDRNFDTRGKKFLRGHQLTNERGIVEFMTIYPGWYPGRTVHIHFKIRTDPNGPKGREFTSQLYFDDQLTDEIHRLPPYNAKGSRTTTNATDLVFRRRGNQLLLPLTRDGQGYRGTFDIALQFA